MLLASAIFLVLAPLVTSRPTTTSPSSFSELFSSIDRRQAGPIGGGGLFGKKCDLSYATMPIAPTPLPAPDAGQTLSSVVLGRGTQNYTCDTANPQSTPAAAGAVAALFDASCIAATVPSILELMPNIALQFPVPPSDGQSLGSPAQLLLAGQHYFLDLKTPFFNLDVPRRQKGVVAAQKANESLPPAGSPLGPHGQGNGSVSWLRLTAKPGQYNFKTIYRLNTAGGSPPKTCEGMPASFTVDYAAEYWLWN